MMRSANTYEFKGRYILEPLAKSVSGVWISSSPIVILEQEIRPAEMGKALLEALGHSRLGVSHPLDWSVVPKDLYAAAGVPGWSTFIKGSTRCVVVHDEKGELRLTPTRNAGVKKGFLHLEDLAVVLPTQAPFEEIGLSILVALDLCD